MARACLRVLTLSFVALVLLALFLDRTTAAPPSQDYQNVGDLYDWLMDHELERREIPSMRLRFGKRDDPRAMWTVAQRSMPSLRLRFGKRDGEGEQVGWNEPEVERRGGSRTPGLRMRFGKREVDPQQSVLLSSTSENH